MLSQYEASQPLAAEASLLKCHMPGSLTVIPVLFVRALPGNLPTLAIAEGHLCNAYILENNTNHHIL